MKTRLKIGLIIADEMEYAAWEEVIDQTATRRDFYARKGHTYCIIKDGKTIQIDSILCGIGMINATAAAMHLVENGVDILLNYGLSGGISGVRRGDEIIGSSFIEHDFDLVCCGYKKCEKPNQTYLYNADSLLCELLQTIKGGAKSGRLASGDRFVSDPVLRDALKNEFSVAACDMETAAIAYISHLTNTPFTCLRRISDDAGEDAVDDYREINHKPMVTLAQDMLQLAQTLWEQDLFWN